MALGRLSSPCLGTYTHTWNEQGSMAHAPLRLAAFTQPDAHEIHPSCVQSLFFFLAEPSCPILQTQSMAPSPGDGPWFISSLGCNEHRCCEHPSQAFGWISAVLSHGEILGNWRAGSQVTNSLFHFIRRKPQTTFPSDLMVLQQRWRCGESSPAPALRAL